MSRQSQVTRVTWKQILASAVAILDDLERRQLGTPDVVIGGGTVLMFRFEHRLSKDSASLKLPGGTNVVESAS